MKKINKSNGISELSPRAFTFHQLSNIRDENYGVMEKSMDLSSHNDEEIFILYPIMGQYDSFGEKGNPHMRTLVTDINEREVLSLQDITYEQWEQGKEIHKIAS